MLEARLEQASTLKKLLDAVKELVTDANFECTDAGISLQAMDNSHVALVNVMLREDAFQNYRCDRNMPLGINLASLTKVLKCAKDNDLVTLKASDDADSLALVFEAPHSDRIGEYEIKLMDIDQEHLGIPDTSYDAQVTMSSSEFQKICRDLTTLGESVRIEVTKEGVRFASDGEIGSASVFLNAGGNVNKAAKKVKSESASPRKKVKKEKVKKEKNDDDEEMDGEEEQEEEEEEVEEVEDEEDEEEKPKKKRKAAGEPAGAKGKKAKKGDSDESEIAVSIVLQQSVTLTFSLKYLLNFAKSAPLSKSVSLNLSNDVPLLVSFDFDQGYINYYLAPKIGDE